MSNKFCDFTMQTQFIYIDSNRKCQNVQVLSLCKLSSFTLFSTELPLIFSAGSRPFWQEAEALKKYCFRFQPSSIKYHNFKVISLIKLSSYTLISTELPLIFSAGSGPFWQANRKCNTSPHHTSKLPPEHMMRQLQRDNSENFGLIL